MSTSDLTATNKAVIERLVREVINNGRLDVLDELYTSDAAVAARDWIARSWHPSPTYTWRSSNSSQKTTRSLDDSPARPPSTVPGSATRQPAAASRTSTRSASIRCATAGSPRPGAWKTPGSDSGNSVLPPRREGPGTANRRHSSPCYRSLSQPSARKRFSHHQDAAPDLREGPGAVLCLQQPRPRLGLGSCRGWCYYLKP